MSIKNALIISEKQKMYDMGKGHPFRGDRFENFLSEFHNLETEVQEQYFDIIEPNYCSEEDLLLVHNSEFLSLTKRLAGRKMALTPDTPLTPEILAAAKLAVGAGMLAGRLVFEENQYLAAFSMGGGLHHASINRGGGFCVFNDVAITTQWLLNQGLERILIIDTDAHAGDGTMDVFYEDSRVLFMSLHQDPRTLYPGVGHSHEIGREEGEGYTVNVPLPPGSGDKSWEFALREIFIPLAQEFHPQVILRNGGSDPHFADEITSLELTVAGLRRITSIVRQTSQELCRGKFIDFCGSGYNPVVLPKAWLGIILGGAGLDQVELEEPVKPSRELEPFSIFKRSQSVIEAVKEIQKDYWNCF